MEGAEVSETESLKNYAVLMELTSSYINKHYLLTLQFSKEKEN